VDAVSRRRMSAQEADDEALAHWLQAQEVEEEMRASDKARTSASSDPSTFAPPPRGSVRGHSAVDDVTLADQIVMFVASTGGEEDEALEYLQRYGALEPALGAWERSAEAERTAAERAARPAARIDSHRPNASAPGLRPTHSAPAFQPLPQRYATAAFGQETPEADAAAALRRPHPSAGSAGSAVKSSASPFEAAYQSRPGWAAPARTKPATRPTTNALASSSATGLKKAAAAKAAATTAAGSTGGAAAVGEKQWWYSRQRGEWVDPNSKETDRARYQRQIKEARENPAPRKPKGEKMAAPPGTAATRRRGYGLGAGFLI